MTQYLSAPTCPACQPATYSVATAPDAEAIRPMSVATPFLVIAEHGLFTLVGAVMGWLIISAVSQPDGRG